MAQRLSSMSDEERMISVIQEERRAFAYLLNQRKTIRELIGRPDALLASEQIPHEGFGRLHSVAQRYQAAVNAIKRVAQQDATLAKKEPQYLKRLTEQLIEVDSILTKLREAMLMSKLPHSRRWPNMKVQSHMS